MAFNENEETPFVCPFCEKELILPKEAAQYYTCEYCGKRIDLPAQFAFNRGLEAFKEGQAAYQGLKYLKKKRAAYDAAELTVVRIFEKAYFSIQQAFATDLAEPQRALGVEMMVNMAQLFTKRDLISGLEASYWGLLMVEHTAQEEYDVLRQKIANPAGALGLIKQIRWRSRKGQLKRALVKLDQKIRYMETHMAFTYPIHARKSHWKPGD